MQNDYKQDIDSEPDRRHLEGDKRQECKINMTGAYYDLPCAPFQGPFSRFCGEAVCLPASVGTRTSFITTSFFSASMAPSNFLYSNRSSYGAVLFMPFLARQTFLQRNKIRASYKKKPPRSF
jgi:hypothetical protein